MPATPMAILKASCNGCTEIPSVNLPLISSGFHRFMVCIIGKTSHHLAVPVSPSVVMVALEYDGVMQVS